MKILAIGKNYINEKKELDISGNLVRIYYFTHIEAKKIIKKVQKNF